jgi:hypothetical protein
MVCPTLFYRAKGWSSAYSSKSAGPAEDYVGAFHERYPELAASGNVSFLTKWVPRPGPMPVAVVEQALAVSRRYNLLLRISVNTLRSLIDHSVLSSLGSQLTPP